MCFGVFVQAYYSAGKLRSRAMRPRCMSGSEMAEEAKSVWSCGSEVIVVGNVDQEVPSEEVVGLCLFE